MTTKLINTSTLCPSWHKILAMPLIVTYQGAARDARTDIGLLVTVRCVQLERET